MTQARRKVNRRRRGFAVLTAIVLTALVAVAMTAALSVFRANVRRTAAALDDAQLRQLLLAGERVARQRLAAPPAPAGQGGPVELPPSLSQDGATLRVDAAGPATERAAVFRVIVTLGGRRASQTLQYEAGAGGWALVHADLESFQSDSPRPR